MSQLYAKAAALLAVSGNPSQKTATLQFRDAKNQTYAIEFPEALLGSLIMALTTTAQGLSPSGQAQPMNLTSGRIFQLSDGRTGLELTLEGSLRVPVVFPKEAIEQIRKSLDELERQPSAPQPIGKPN